MKTANGDMKNHVLKTKTYLTNSSPCISEHPAVTIPHSISGLCSTPGVSYAVYSIEKLTFTTVPSETEDQPRPGREQNNSNSGLSVVDAKLADDRFNEVEASSEVSSAILLNTS